MDRPQIQGNNPMYPAQDGQMSTRTLSVDQALTYTPFTTSVLPAYNRIPIPEVVRLKENGRVATNVERKQVQTILDSFPVQKIKDRLEGLLNPDVLSEFNFKNPPRVGRLDKQGIIQHDKHVFDKLSPLAKTVLKMPSIDYRYPSPVSPDRSTRRKSQQVISKAIPSETITVSQEPKPVARAQSISQSISQLSVQVPVPSVDFKREDYVTAPGSPKRRKLSHEEDQSLQTRTQREAADAAVQQFQDNLFELFEAQDRLEPGNDNDMSGIDDRFFDPTDEDEDGDPRLNNKTLERLQTHLKKLVSLKRLGDISLEHLRRLQQLCENAIERTQTMPLQLPTESNDEDRMIWQTRIRKVENGALAAATFIYTILGCPNEEGLLSMDVLRWIPNVLVNIFENCIIPIIESRSDGTTTDLFQSASYYRDDIRRLLEASRRLLDLTATACTDVKGGDAYVNAIEFLAAKLIFVQNAITDKGSALGLQTFERARKTAMAVLAKLYTRFPRERPAILDEILTSLDKLPSTSRSARQFRVGDGNSIQLISALFMQLVQTSSMEAPKNEDKAPKMSKKQDLIAEDDEDDNSDMEMDQVGNDLDLDPVTRLQQKVDQLFNSAAKSAQDIVSYLVGRASKTTKSGDSPYRSILDLFIEDLIVVLPSYDWPSSELLLRALASRMTDLARHEKAAMTKNMGLEALGVMGSAISHLKASIPNLSAAVSREEVAIHSESVRHLVKLAEAQVQNGGLQAEELIALNGPLSTVAQHLLADSGKHNLQKQSAQSYFLAHYAKLVDLSVQSQVGEEINPIVNWILARLSESTSDSPPSTFAVSENVAELAYTLTILNLGFCRRLYDIVKTLSTSVSSDQALVRSRSLKSVLTVLESDSSLLDRDPTIADDIFRCASDESALVRDSALSLIARFVISKPALQQKGIKRLLECAEDSKTGVQKRAIVHLKDVYLNDERPQLRAAIARKFLHRLADHEESIVILTKQTLDDIWIKPTMSIVQNNADSAKAEVAVQDLAAHLMTCISSAPEELIPLLKAFFNYALHKDKQVEPIRSFCSQIVEVLFEMTISEEKNQTPLLVLTAFAEADSKLIPPPRLAKLQSYLSDIKTDNDLYMFRSAIKIFCCVLPNISDTHKALLKDIQDALMRSINKLGRRVELDAVMVCLRTIDGVLHNSERLIRLAASIFNQILSKTVPVPSLLKLLRIAGAIGKEIDFEPHSEAFAKQVPSFKNGTVAAHLAATLYPLTQEDRPIEVRLIAFASLGSVCQASPGLLNKPLIRDAIFSVFKCGPNQVAASESFELQTVVLRIVDEIYSVRAAAKEKSEKEEKEQQGLKQLGGDSRTRDEDSAVSAVTPSVVDVMLKIALAEQSENALLAARTLSSISHQGLIHPKQCLGAFVALSTSTNPKIAEVGGAAHHLLHEQHESHCEREYMQAIHEAFEYQRDVCKDPTGAVQPGNKAKLARCFEIISSSSSKYVKKFLSGLISRTIIDGGNEASHFSISQVHYTRFVVQNIALAEFKRLDELLHAILQLELAYSKMGGEVAQMIETSLQSHPDIPVNNEVFMNGDFPAEPIMTTDPNLIVELKRMAPAASNLMLLIEARSYLLRQYGIGRDVRIAMNNQKQAKDTNKAPNRIHGITGERFWNKSNSVVTALVDDNAVVTLCKEFIAAMSVEDDLELGNDDVAIVDSSEMNGIPRLGTPGNRKRKHSLSTAGTPTKKAKNRPKKGTRRSNSISSLDDPEGDYEE